MENYIKAGYELVFEELASKNINVLTEFSDFTEDVHDSVLIWETPYHKEFPRNMK